MHLDLQSIQITAIITSLYKPSSLIALFFRFHSFYPTDEMSLWGFKVCSWSNRAPAGPRLSKASGSWMSIKTVFLSAQTLEEFRGRARQSARKVGARRKSRAFTHFRDRLNLWSGLNPSPSGNYRDDFVRTSCSGGGGLNRFPSIKGLGVAPRVGGSSCSACCSAPCCRSAALNFVTRSRSHAARSVWSTVCRYEQTCGISECKEVLSNY